MSPRAYRYSSSLPPSNLCGVLTLLSGPTHHSSQPPPHVTCQMCECFLCVARLLQALLRNWEMLSLFSFACVGRLPSRVWLLLTQGCRCPDLLRMCGRVVPGIWLTHRTASHASHPAVLCSSEDLSVVSCVGCCTW